MARVKETGLFWDAASRVPRTNEISRRDEQDAVVHEVCHAFDPEWEKTLAENSIGKLTPNSDEMRLFEKLDLFARLLADGHMTIMRFTGNWRVCFYTPSDRDGITGMAVGDTFVDAASNAIDMLRKATEPNIEKDPDS